VDNGSQTYRVYNKFINDDIALTDPYSKLTLGYKVLHIYG